MTPGRALGHRRSAAYRLAAAPGAFFLTGGVADMRRLRVQFANSYRLSCEPGRFMLTGRDATLTVGESVQGPFQTDFAARVAALGTNLVRSYNMPSLGSVIGSSVGTPAPNVGYIRGAYAGAPPDLTTNKADPVLDNTFGIPAIKFTIPTRSGSLGMGRWLINFSDDCQTRFDGDDPNNNEFYMQIRCRFDDAFMTTMCYQGYTPGSTQCTAGVQGLMTAMKILDIDMQDYPPNLYNDSNSSIELICGTFEQRRTWEWYQGGDHAARIHDTTTWFSDEVQVFDPYSRLVIGSGPARQDSVVQNGVTLADGVTRPARYNTLHTPGNGNNNYGNAAPGTSLYGGPGTPDHGYGAEWFPNEWMTFQVHVKLGPSYRDANNKRFWSNCRFRCWQARENQPSILVHDHTSDWMAGNPGGSYDCKFGKLWMGPYMTCKDPYQEHPEFHMWCAEFIVARTPIRDPMTGTYPPGAVAASPLDSIIPGHVRDLGLFSDPLEGAPGYGHAEYGSLSYDAARGQMIQYGGGHTTGNNHDNVLAFSPQSATVPFRSLYARTSDAEMARHGNPSIATLTDTIPMMNAGTASLDGYRGRWTSTGNRMAAHPFTGAFVLGDRYYVMDDGGVRSWFLDADSTLPVNVAPGAYSFGTVNGQPGCLMNAWHLPAYLDLTTNRWVWLDEMNPPLTQNGARIDATPWYYCVTARPDPVSGKVLLVGYTKGLAGAKLWVFDPVANTIVETTVWPIPNFDDSTYPPDIIYHPPSDKFICVLPSWTKASTGVFQPAKVYALTFNRSNYNASTYVAVPTTGTVPRGVAAGANAPTIGAYVPSSQLIVGWVAGGYYYALAYTNGSPGSGVWSEHRLLNDDGSASTVSCDYANLAFDPVTGCVIFLDPSPHHVHAFRPMGV